MNESVTDLFEGMFRSEEELRTLHLLFRLTKFSFSKPAGVILANILRHKDSSL
jgi:hypothetical protein